MRLDEKEIREGDCVRDASQASTAHHAHALSKVVFRTIRARYFPLVIQTAFLVV